MAQPFRQAANFISASLSSVYENHSVLEPKGRVELLPLKIAINPNSRILYFSRYLLALDEYSKGIEYLSKAEKRLKNNSNSDYILDNTNLEKCNFQKVIRLSKTRQNNAVNILQVSKVSLRGGLKNSSTLLKALSETDEVALDVRDDFSRVIEQNEFSKLQKEYLSLEVQAFQFRDLNPVNQTIQKVEIGNAGDLALKAFNAASSVLLTEIIDVVANDKITLENVVTKIVMQNQQRGTLSKIVGELEQNLTMEEGF